MGGRARATLAGMASPKTSLISRLHGTKGLSASQRRIADCLVGRLHEAAFWGVEELAARSQSSVATVVRFAQKLGYSGFLELRHALVAQAKRQARFGETLLQAPSEAAAALVEVARRDVRNIEQMIQGVDEPLLEAVVARLRQARLRLAIGDGVSALMTRHLAYLLTQAGLPCLEGSSADFATQVVNLGPGDVVIAISINPYSRETMDAVSFARRRGIPVLAFTDRIRSPLARLAENVLPVPGENLLYSHSLAAFAVLAHAIATSVATRDREGILLKLREAERVARPKFAVE